MDRCLFDTSAVSDFLQPLHKRSPAVVARLRQYLRAHGQVTLSEMSCFEILRGLRKKRAVLQVQQFQRWCQHSELLPVTYDILDRAATLWADGQNGGVTVDDTDLVIAATALVTELPLVSANPRHFAWISGLNVLNWRE